MSCVPETYDEGSAVDFTPQPQYGATHAGAAFGGGFDYLASGAEMVPPGSPMVQAEYGEEEDAFDAEPAFAHAGAPAPAMPVPPPSEAESGDYGHEPEYDYPAPSMIDDGDLGETRIPFAVEFQPSKLARDGRTYVVWSVKDVFPEPFSSPGDDACNDSAVLGGVDLYDVKHDFGDQLAVQVSLKDATGAVKNVHPDQPDDSEGQRLFGAMLLGSHRNMPVHGIVDRGAKKEIRVLDQPASVHESYLESINASIPKGAKPWTKTRLVSEGVVPNTERHGTLLVANRNPVLGHINQTYGNDAHGHGLFATAGPSHTTVSEQLFNKHVHMIMAESAKNIKLGDVRNNLKIFVTRNVPGSGFMDDAGVWANPKRIFDHITPGLSGDALDRAKSRVLDKKYTVSGVLALTYVPLKKPIDQSVLLDRY